MISIEQYPDYIFEDLEHIFKLTNLSYYNHCESLGLEIDLSNKNQKNIYTHFFITHLCDRIKVMNKKVVFYINEFSICCIHKQIIKKIIRIFGFKIWSGHYTMSDFLHKLIRNESELVDRFEMYLNINSSPKSFRQIKKFLEKEGFTNLSDSYFQDIANKMAILC